MRDTNSLNKVILVGRLGQKPEMRAVAQTGRQVANFSLATNERFVDKNTRENKDRTEWHKIVVWGNLAEFCDRNLDKGKLILVEGKLRTRSWQDRAGNKQTRTEIEAENIVLLGKREGGPAADQAPEAEGRGAAQAEEGFPQPDEGGSGEDDIPF